MALADTARLVASLELQDKFSATARKFDSTVANMDRRAATLNKIGGQIGQGVRNTAQNLQRIAVVGGAVLATQIAAGVRSLAELEEQQGQTAARIEATGGAANVTADEVRALSEEIENLSTVDDKAIQAGQNMLLTFRNIRNEVGEGNDIFNQATRAVVDLAVAMGTEPEQAALQLGKALNDPIRGLTALRRVGVQFTEEQEEQIRTMVEAGRTMDAQKVILRELAQEFGGSAEAFGKSGPGATMRRFADAVEEGQQALARGFLPLMERVAALATEAFSDPKVIAGIERFGEGLAGGLDQLIDIAQRLPWSAIGSSLEIAGTGAKAVLDAFTSLPPWIQTAVLTGWGLNKLTGGALGGIAGTLTKALMPGGGLRGTPANPVFVRVLGAPGGLGGAAGGAAGGFSFGRLALQLSVLGTAALALTQAAEAIEPEGDDRRRMFGNEKTINRVEFPKDLTVKLDGKAVVSGPPHPQETAALEGIGQSIDVLRQSAVQALKEGDINAARHAQRQIDNLNELRGTVDRRINDIIPHLGQTNRALSIANRNLADGNARQREIAAKVDQQRATMQTGFDRNNAQLGIIAAKDFSPDVNVTVPVTTHVSITDIIREASTYNVATSLASQTRRGFTP